MARTASLKMKFIGDDTIALFSRGKKVAEFTGNYRFENVSAFAQGWFNSAGKSYRDLPLIQTAADRKRLLATLAS